VALPPELIQLALLDQREENTTPQDYFARENEEKLIELAKNKEIIIITGVRRSGKSVLLHRYRKQAKETDYYFHFEDERLAQFSIEDFQVLQQIFVELYGIQKTYYFDEIQNIPGWEKFVRRLYNTGNKIFITGSNANLFSKELGTHLTGRYITLKVYPLSFYEFVNHNKPELISEKNLSTLQIGQIKRLFNEYSRVGGIPEYVKILNQDYLHSLYESIIYRDIIVKYKLTGDRVIKSLVFYLASNCSKAITYNSLKKYLGLGSATTVADYCSYLESSYLCFFINRYSDSLKVQVLSPKKVYFIDPVLAKIVGFRVSEDAGRMLENIVFLELKRRHYDIYYHHGKKECDFVLRKNNQIVGLLQVCKTVASIATKKRELEGLTEALAQYQLMEGYILTENESATKTIQQDGKKYKIITMPVWKWLIQKEPPSSMMR